MAGKRLVGRHRLPPAQAAAPARRSRTHHQPLDAARQVQRAWLYDRGRGAVEVEQLKGQLAAPASHVCTGARDGSEGSAPAGWGRMG